MNQLDGLRRYLEAATNLTQITRGRAEELVRDLVASGELERNRAQEWIEDLLRRSREASEALVATISTEVDHQLGERGFKNLDLDDLAQRVAGIIELAGSVGRNVSVPKVWSRGQDDQTRTAGDARNGATHPDSGHTDSGPTDSGSKAKPKGGSGKKKGGSDKSGAKAKKSDGKKSGSKKNGPKKSDSHKDDPGTTDSGTTDSGKTDSVPTAATESTSSVSTPVVAEDVAERSDHGATT